MSAAEKSHLFGLIGHPVTHSLSPFIIGGACPASVADFRVYEIRVFRNGPEGHSGIQAPHSIQSSRSIRNRVAMRASGS